MQENRHKMYWEWKRKESLSSWVRRTSFSRKENKKRHILLNKKIEQVFPKTFRPCSLPVHISACHMPEQLSIVEFLLNCLNTQTSCLLVCWTRGWWWSPGCDDDSDDSTDYDDDGWVDDVGGNDNGDGNDNGWVVLVILGCTWWPAWPGSPLLKANKDKQRQSKTNKNKQIQKNTDKMWVVLVTLGGLCSLGGCGACLP